MQVMARIQLVSLFFFVAIGVIGIHAGYYDHPCTRNCTNDAPAMECLYDFTLEWYQTMSKACFDCPVNVTDCFRPHCVFADGHKRAIMTINRMFPGPSVQVCQGDTIVATVHNHLQSGEGTSIHWHGIQMRGEQYMDGVGGLTQCPINELSSFEYRFKASTPGTHFWHSHTGFQRGDGVAGPLVVRQPPKAEPHHAAYDYDLPEHYILVNDWMLSTSIEKFMPHHHGNGDNKPRSMTVNGKSSFNPYNNTETNELVFTPKEVFNVEQGKRFRFRLASNAILNCPIQVSVDNHNLTIIATDGMPVVGRDVESFIVYGGERFDFIITANQDIDNYWMKFRGLADCSVHEAHTFAILRYRNASIAGPNEPTGYASTHRSGKLLNPFNHVADEDHIPVYKLDALDTDDDMTSQVKPDIQFYISFDFNKIDNLHYHHPDYYPIMAVPKENGHLYTPQLNFIANAFPSSPMLSQPEDVDEDKFCDETTVHNCSMEYCECSHVLRVKLGQVVELVLVDKGVTFDASHPMHLHGYSFRVMDIEKVNKSVSVDQVKQMDREGKINRKLRNAVKKDTVIVPDGGFTIIRFHATNPGTWFFHCHLEWHAVIGMGLVFKVGEQSDLPPVPHGFPKCGSYKFQSAPPPPTKKGNESEPRSSAVTARTAISVLFISVMACVFLVKK